ncbi:MAG: pyridine nucleotide-disulfide oxidoreductase [Planctomycetes bacterium RBG_13_60_9]|nr:MAG: pyridine nucleotide-disulfide oxidoreductase [Planctomycetes bacterium RBG_13_60_9]
MAHYRYLIIGGGMTGDAATQGIREVDAKGTIGLIGSEPDPPYKRPPLTKGLWKDKPLDSIWRHTEDRQVDLLLGRRAKTLDVNGNLVVDDRGDSYTYDKLLLATGGQPRRLPFGEDQIIYYRTLEDYRRLRALAEQCRRFAVIGGGFIGSEIAAALAMNDREVTLIFPGPAISSRLFPPDLSEFLNKFYREKGIEVLAGETITGFERRDEESVLFTSGNRQVTVDGVVAGVGILPEVELAKQAGLEVEDGIVVDEFCGTSRPDVYAAGDVALFLNPAMGRHLRVEHEDNANTMGRVAGRNMAGDPTLYHHLPYFYSDLFDLGYEAIGELDPRLEIVPDWQEKYQKGVIYYVKDRRVRGVLLWNVWEQVDAARKLIESKQPFRPQDLQGLLPVAKDLVAAEQK